MNLAFEEYPLVSVFIASYNNSKYVEQSLESVRRQTYPSIELIVVDDASTDNSVEVIRNWIKRTGYPCKLIVNPVNLGVCKSSNIFLKYVKGEYISWLASDDVMMSEKLSVQVPLLMASDTNVALVFSDVYVIDDSGIEQAATLIEDSGINIHSLVSGNTFENLLRRDFVPAPSALFKTNIIEEMNGYDENLSYEDWDMLLRIVKKYKIIYSDYVSAKYRVVATSLWHSRSTKFYESTIELLIKHLGYSEKGDSIIFEHISNNSELIYKTGGASASKWLKKRWQNQRSLTAGLLYGMASLGLPYKAFDLLRGTLRT